MDIEAGYLEGEFKGIVRAMDDETVALRITVGSFRAIRPSGN